MIKKFVEGGTANNEYGGPGNKYFDCTITMAGYSTTKQCPFLFRDLAFYDAFDIKYTLRNADGFYDDLNKTFSIPKEWVTFYDLDNSSNQCIGGNHPGNGGNPARRGVSDDVPEENGGASSHRLEKRYRRTGYRFYGLPKGKDDFTMPNPKDTINKAKPKILDLSIKLVSRQV